MELICSFVCLVSFRDEFIHSLLVCSIINDRSTWPLLSSDIGPQSDWPFLSGSMYKISG